MIIAGWIIVFIFSVGAIVQARYGKEEPSLKIFSLLFNGLVIGWMLRMMQLVS